MNDLTTDHQRQIRSEMNEIQQVSKSPAMFLFEQGVFVKLEFDFWGDSEEVLRVLMHLNELDTTIYKTFFDNKIDEHLSSLGTDSQSKQIILWCIQETSQEHSTNGSR